jgi:uncharacterized protein YyaL (SSP411 family)
MDAMALVLQKQRPDANPVSVPNSGRIQPCPLPPTERQPESVAAKSTPPVSDSCEQTTATCDSGFEAKALRKAPLNAAGMQGRDQDRISQRPVSAKVKVDVGDTGVPRVALANGKAGHIRQENEDNQHRDRRFRTPAILCIALVGSVLAALGTTLAEGESEPTPAKGGQSSRFSNRLSRETSPYLLAHAHNPVDWYPWGPEALAKAKKEDKPIFLSIGYSSCHWCHVMEKQVFSDPEIARYMNENFVNIKVDREERPDLDDVYMTALQVYFQAMRSNQTGGWPLSIFLTPDGRPLGGGTYFPPNDDNGRMGFPTLMKRVITAWKDSRKQLEENADILADGVRASLKTRVLPDPVTLEIGLVAPVLKSLADTYDEQFGGFGFTSKSPDRPKFPVPSKLALLQYEAKRRNNDNAATMLYLTLDRMAAGGIYDHVGGGFHRYSTDRFWRVPHFEKMLYDNAQLIDVYAEAYHHSNQKHYQEVVEESIEFVFRELRDPKGGFYAALDADSEGVEGKFYVWTDAELAKVLTPEERATCNAVYGTGGEQNFEIGHVLELKQSVDDAAKILKRPALQLEQQRRQIDKKLLAARQKRRRPTRDDKILVSWNGLMIRALAKAGVILQKPEYVQAAEKTADFILNEMRDNKGRLLHTYAAGKARLGAYLDDYAFFIEGLLALHLATNDEKWVVAARTLSDLQMELFWDEEGKACYFTSHDHEQLLARTKNPYDSVLPSGNSVSVRNLLRLATIGKQGTYRDRARETLELFAPLIQGSPSGLTNMSLALAEYLDTAETAGARPRARGPNMGISPEAGIILAGGSDEKRSKSSKKGTSKPQVVAGEVFLSVDKLPPGKTCKVLLQLQIEDGWHIHANPPGDPDLDIPTEVEFTQSKLGIELKNVKFPKGKSVDREPGEKPQILYTDKVNIKAEFDVPAKAAGRDEELVFTVSFQACNDSQCLRPDKLTLKVPVKVARSDEQVKPVNESLFAPASGKKKTR